MRGLRRLAADFPLARGTALAALAALAAVSCPWTPPPVEAVVIVTLDTTRADRIGCYGHAGIETPALDGIAREGVLFEQACAVAPITLPSHASLFTGRYPAAHGARNNGLYVVPGSERTLAEVFKAHGYDTAAFVGAFPLASAFGLRQGFDTYDEAFHRAGEDAATAPSGYSERSAAEVNAGALRWLASRQGRKIFLWVHYFDPHAPYTPPAPFSERYAGAPYDGEIAFCDAQLARLLEAVARVAPPERTVIAVAGDHGESLGEHGETYHGVFVYDATIRSPLLLRAPGRLPAGGRVAEPVSLVDLFPTLLRLAGLDAEIGSGPDVHGVDLAPLARREGRSEPAGARPILMETFLTRLEFGWSELVALREGSYKFVRAPRRELYELTSDPAERSNLLDSPSPDAASRAAAMDSRLGTELSRASAGAGAEAGRAADAETLERLRSLGYLQGPAAEAGAGGVAPGASVRRDPKDMIGLYEQINEVGVLLRRADFDGAAVLARSALARDPTNSRVQWWLAEALMAGGKFAEAERLVRPLLDKGPETFWAASVLARARESQGDLDGALSYYRQALRADPDYAVNGARIASVLFRQGKLEDASREARAVLERSPGRVEALEIAAECAKRTGNAQEAVALWQGFLESAPDNPAGLSGLGRALFDAQRFRDAQAVFESLASAAPDRPEPPRFLGALAVLRGDYGEAVPLLRRASAMDPDDPTTRTWLGMALVKAGDLAGAERQILPLLSRHGDSFAAHRALGMLRRAQGRDREAVSAFRKALSLNPADGLSARLLKETGAGP